MSISIKNVCKSYGTQEVLKNISFEVPRGQIAGLLGPNGAGKSTLMKIITTYITPDKGEVNVAGFSIRNNPMEVRKNIGYLPEHNPLYPDMYVKEYLHFCRSFYKGIPPARVDEIIEITGLTPEMHKKIGQLSKGYRQRVGLAAAIIHDPPVLILDEPTTGLDPNQLSEIRKLIRKLGKEKSILLSTHIMQEVEQLAHRVLILQNGEIRLDKKIDELETGTQTIHVVFDLMVEPQWFQSFPHLSRVENTGETSWKFHFETSEDMRPLLFDFAVRQGLKILEIHTSQTGLEEIFRDVTRA